MINLAEIIEGQTGHRLPVADHVVTDTVIDSREVIPGALFVALAGEKVDGHDYVKDAFSRGAHFALVERCPSEAGYIIDLRSGVIPEVENIGSPPFCLLVENSLEALQKVARHWRRKIDVRVIGITGSVGKSTTKEVVAEVLRRRFRTLKNPGSLNNEIGLPLTLMQLSADHDRAVLEMGLYVPGEIAFLCDIAIPHVGLVTNIGIVHAERAGSQEAIARGKTELVQALPPDGYAVLNYDDPLVKAMAADTQAHVFYYGLDPAADLWADEVVGLGLDGIRFRLHYGRETLHLRVPLIGRHSVHTALRAAAVGLIEGLTWQEIIEGMRSGKAQLRLVAVWAKSGALLLDDTYNASPQSTMAALNLLEELAGRKVAVLGDMLELGPYEKQGHEMVGVRVAEVVDELITVGTRAQIIASAARSSGLSPDRVREFAKPQEALDFLQKRLRTDDVVLVKGSRGMQMEVIVAGLEMEL